MLKSLCAATILTSPSPAGALDRSPRRKPWEQVKTEEPRNGAKDNASVGSFAPSRGSCRIDGTHGSRRGLPSVAPAGLYCERDDCGEAALCHLGGRAPAHGRWGLECSVAG